MERNGQNGLPKHKLNFLILQIIPFFFNHFFQLSKSIYNIFKSQLCYLIFACLYCVCDFCMRVCEVTNFFFKHVTWNFNLNNIKNEMWFSIVSSQRDDVFDILCTPLVVRRWFYVVWTIRIKTSYSQVIVISCTCVIGNRGGFITHRLGFWIGFSVSINQVVPYP